MFIKVRNLENQLDGEGCLSEMEVNLQVYPT